MIGWCIAYHAVRFDSLVADCVPLNVLVPRLFHYLMVISITIQQFPFDFLNWIAYKFFNICGVQLRGYLMKNYVSINSHKLCTLC